MIFKDPSECSLSCFTLGARKASAQIAQPLWPFWFEKSQTLFPLLSILSQGDLQRLPTDRVASAGEQSRAVAPDFHESHDCELMPL
jgi:hypothetical protein